MFDDFRRVLGNGIRFNHDPTAGVTEAGGQSYRGAVFACAEEFFLRLPLAGGGALAAALAREGTAVTPFWTAFAGAGATLRALEEFHGAHYAETFPIYYRDGVYHAEDGFADPDDYMSFVRAPIFLADVFERLLVGVFNAPTAAQPARMMSAWYADTDAVGADVQRAIENAMAYFDGDEEVKERLEVRACARDCARQCRREPALAAAPRARTHMPSPPHPPGHGRGVGGVLGENAAGH